MRKFLEDELACQVLGSEKVLPMQVRVRVKDGCTVLTECRDSVRNAPVLLKMMMSFICSCRNKKEEPSSIYTFRKVRTIRGCLEGLALMI